MAKSQKKYPLQQTLLNGFPKRLYQFNTQQCMRFHVYCPVSSMPFKVSASFSTGFSGFLVDLLFSIPGP